ncbi:MAG: hypothetical protein K0V04_09650 [Deltaproteobacteria bacterium]|nr:hypothetical protein [Deltaproteobacteria bacterium]
MSVAVVRLWLGVLLAGAPSACGVDLLVGGAETGSSSSGTVPPPSDDTTTTAAPPPADSSGTTGTNPTTTGASTTSDSTTGPLQEDTSTGMEEGTTGPLSCDGLGFGDCNEISYCLWYGERANGECALSPCEDKRNQCWGLLEQGPCVEELACAWSGDPGECSPIECAPCEVLTELQCEETPTCFWQDLKEFCLAVR